MRNISRLLRAALAAAIFLSGTGVPTAQAAFFASLRLRPQARAIVPLAAPMRIDNLSNISLAPSAIAVAPGAPIPATVESPEISLAAPEISAEVAPIRYPVFSALKQFPRIAARRANATLLRWFDNAGIKGSSLVLPAAALAGAVAVIKTVVATGGDLSLAHALTAPASLALMTAAVPYQPKAKRPRIGFEIEFSKHNAEGPISEDVTAETFGAQSSKMLAFWKSKVGGEIAQLRNNPWVWTLTPPDGGEFWIEPEFASHNRFKDGYEFVTPPMAADVTAKLLFPNYDEFLRTAEIGANSKTAAQFNMEIRDLIEGLPASARDGKSNTIPRAALENANIDGVVNLLLFLEANAMNVYAAYCPQRLGNLMNHFSLPYSLEQVELLKELAAMPKSERTYGNVRRVFQKYSDREAAAMTTDHGAPSRRKWKFRAFNLEKFLRINTDGDQTIYPVMEIRIGDTPESARELEEMTELSYRLFNVGSRTRMKQSDFDESSMLHYRRFFEAYHGPMSFGEALRVANQAMVSEGLSAEFRKSHRAFLKSLGFPTETVPFAKSPASPWVSQTYRIFDFIGPKKTFNYAGRQVTVPEIRVPWSLDKYSWGLEFEFDSADPAFIAKVRQIPFLDGTLDQELDGNKEVRTKPTKSLQEMAIQIQYMRDMLGTTLKSIHRHQRLPADYYETVTRIRYGTWFAWFADWMTGWRARHYAAYWAFGVWTQGRLYVDTVTGWLEGTHSIVRRGSTRLQVIPENGVDFIDSELRGFMSGLPTTTHTGPDYFVIATLIELLGIQQPELMNGMYAHRLFTEFQNPGERFESIMDRYAQARGGNLSQAAFTIAQLIDDVGTPSLMILPLHGFEFLPQFGGHDAHRIQEATALWKQRVHDLLFNKAGLGIEAAQKAFLETLKAWVRESDFDRINFDALLVLAREGATWTELNLPIDSLRAGFLAKFLNIQGTENNKAGIDLFLVRWLQNDPTSLYSAAKQLDAAQRERLARIFVQNLSPEASAAILVQLGVAPFPKENRADDHALTANLDALLAAQGLPFRVRPRDVTALEAFAGFLDDAQPEELTSAAFIDGLTAHSRLVKARDVALDGTDRTLLIEKCFAFLEKTEKSDAVMAAKNYSPFETIFNILWAIAEPSERAALVGRYLGIFFELPDQDRIGFQHPFPSANDPILAPLIKIAASVTDGREKDRVFKLAQNIVSAMYIHHRKELRTEQSRADILSWMKALSSRKRLVQSLEHASSIVYVSSVKDSEWRGFLAFISLIEPTTEERELILAAPLNIMIKLHLESRRNHGNKKFLDELLPFMTPEIRRANPRLVAEYRQAGYEMELEQAIAEELPEATAPTAATAAGAGPFQTRIFVDDRLPSPHDEIYLRPGERQALLNDVWNHFMSGGRTAAQAMTDPNMTPTLRYWFLDAMSKSAPAEFVRYGNQAIQEAIAAVARPNYDRDVVVRNLSMGSTAVRSANNAAQPQLAAVATAPSPALRDVPAASSRFDLLMGEPSRIPLLSETDVVTAAISFGEMRQAIGNNATPKKIEEALTFLQAFGANPNLAESQPYVLSTLMNAFMWIVQQSLRNGNFSSDMRAKILRTVDKFPKFLRADLLRYARLPVEMTASDARAVVEKLSRLLRRKFGDGDGSWSTGSSLYTLTFNRYNRKIAFKVDGASVRIQDVALSSSQPLRGVEEVLAEGIQTPYHVQKMPDNSWSIVKLH